MTKQIKPGTYTRRLITGEIDTVIVGTETAISANGGEPVKLNPAFTEIFAQNEAEAQEIRQKGWIPYVKQ